MRKYGDTTMIWGVSGSFTSGSLTVEGTMQSRDHTRKIKKKAVQSNQGETLTVGYHDPTEEATFTYVCNSATLVNPGTKGTVVDTDYTPWAGTNWIAEEVSTKAVKDNFLEATVKLWRSINIT